MEDQPKKDIENQRLELEWARLKHDRQDTIFRSLTILGAIATFAWTSLTYFDTAKRERAKEADDKAKATAAQRLAAMQPFLERQLRLFEDATQTTAYLATIPESTNRAVKLERFWQLYWGELALVEHGKVEEAMVQFGKGLKKNAAQADLEQLALRVTYACRDELAESWREPSWRHSP